MDPGGAGEGEAMKTKTIKYHEVAITPSVPARGVEHVLNNCLHPSQHEAEGTDTEKLGWVLAQQLQEVPSVEDLTVRIDGVEVEL